MDPFLHPYTIENSFFVIMKRYLTLIALAIGITSLQAATYYATNTATFATGLSSLQNPGDTLYLHGGTYEFSDKVSVNKQGTAAKPIVIIGYPGEKVILDFHKVAYGTRGLTIHANALYVHVKDLTIAWSGKNNLYCEGSYCLFENLDIYGSADTGCQMKKGGNNVIKNVDSHDNFDYETMSGNTANFGGNADGFADKQFTGAGNHYIGCRAWNNSDDGWDFFQRVSTSNSIIENCICYQNGQPYYDMTNNPRATGVDKSWFDSKVGTQMTDRYGNTITISLDRYPCQGNGNGFKMGGNYTDHKILIHHSLAIGNYARGFDQNNNGGTMWVYNNTAYDNNVNYGFTTAYGTNTIQNCISFATQNSDAYKSQNVVTIDHNSWNNGFSVSKNDFQSLDTTQILAPRQADGSLAESTCLHLKSSSALIDAGIDVNLWYNDNAPDLGCYEYPGERHDPIPEDTVPTVQPEGTHKVAFVTIPGCAEDKPLLRYLRQNDSLWIVETEAADATVDYSEYEVIVLGNKPASSAAGFAALKGYNKPMVLLKPWLLKPGAWSWGTAINTADDAVTVIDTDHPLFEGLNITDGSLTLFNSVSTNGVTAISEWSNTDFSVQTLGSPVSVPTASSVAILSNDIIMIGVSEYSMTDISEDGKRLIENAILLQLGIRMPESIENPKSQIKNQKFINNGILFIEASGVVYDAYGRCVLR